jgi:hypothetical protein
MQDMESIVAKVNARVFGTRNAWSLDPAQGNGKSAEWATECQVRLEIQGGRKSGYNLVMAPEGFFAADHWYKTKQEALDSAEELFGIAAGDWSPHQPDAST